MGDGVLVLDWWDGIMSGGTFGWRVLCCHKAVFKEIAKGVCHAKQR